jgi:hypothetical protein
MSKIINAILIGLLGGGCFSAGVYYATLELEEQVNVWDSNYQIITDKVYAFERVSDPETIRHYVKELNKMLDDLEFLNNIIQSGQIADNTLDLFIDKHQKRIDGVNNKILELNKEHMESVTKFNSQIAGLSEDQDELFDTTEDLEIIIKDQSDYISQLNVELGQSITKVEDDIQTIKSSKYGKKIWIVKKKSKKSKIIKSNLETNDLYPPQDTPQQDTFNDQR